MLIRTGSHRSIFFLGLSPCTAVQIWLPNCDLARCWLKLLCWLSRWPLWPSQSNMSQSAHTGNFLFFGDWRALIQKKFKSSYTRGRKSAEEVQVESAGSGGIADCVSSVPKGSFASVWWHSSLLAWQRLGATWSHYPKNPPSLKKYLAPAPSAGYTKKLII